jgi:penicillin G amidase
MKYPLLILLMLGGAASAKGALDDDNLRSHVSVEGLKAKAEILVDHWGVSHIYAGSASDAFFVQGWNAARDRLWQIDLWRRSGLGELSAVLGEKYVAEDRAIRLFEYRGDLQKEWAAYGPDAKSNTESFVAGINAYVKAVRAQPKLMPPEFVLAGFQPAFWKPEDVVRVRNHVLVFGIYFQLVRAQMACKDGPATPEFMPDISPPWTPLVAQGLDFCSIPATVLDQYILGKGRVVFSKPELAAASTSPLDSMSFDDDPRNPNRGSNNWVIAPTRSATGRPILANDPHRSEEVPSVRYLAHLVAPGLDIIGSGEPSVPGISIGHNQNIALGMTVFFIAQEDLYVYETNPQDPNQYRYAGSWEPMRIDHESVQIRGGTKRDIELKFTRHGPVVMEDPAHHRAYAVRATWLDAGGAPYMAAMRYQRAKSVEEVADALKYWGEPGINHVVADTSGKIGWFPAGFTPVRPNTDGLLPLPGDGRYEWQGYLDRDLLPSEVNPSRGYIATANQMNLPKGYPYAERKTSFFWIDNARFNRISEVLDKLPRSTLKDSESLQNDLVNVEARRLVQLLRTIPTADPQRAALIQWFTAWDCAVTAQSPQAALYEVWLTRHLTPGILAKVAPSFPATLAAIAYETHLSHVIDLLEHPDQRLGGNPEQARNELMLSTLTDAAASTQALLGADRTAWRWGRLGTTLLEHALAPLADGPQRAQMTVGPVPKAGDASVVGVAEYDGKTFKTVGGASFRMVLDVGHWDDSVAVNSPGQSGEWTSAHYRDLFPLWLSGQYFPLLYTRSAIEKATEKKLVLEPVPAGLSESGASAHRQR